MKHTALEEAMRFARRKGFIQSGRRMRIEIVDHHANYFRLRIIAVHELLHTLGEVLFGTPLGDLDMPPPSTRLEEHKEVAGPVALVLIVVALRCAGPWS